MAAANQGIDVADATYSLGNYVYLGGGRGSTWFFATYLANAAGGLLTRLPGGDTLLGMNVLSSLAVSAAALGVYGVLRRLMPGWMLFLGLFLAESLCWCPTVILYNYLSYFLLTLGSLFLFLAVTAVPEKKRWFVLAGLCLGLNVTVRFANLTQAALILAFWFFAAVTGRARRVVLRETGLCMAGYAAGFLSGASGAVLRYGASAYFGMIPALFGMTASASDYTLASMLRDPLSAYLHSLRWAAILVSCAAMGAVMLALPAARRFPRLSRAVYLAGIAVLVRFLYGRGMFTANYQDYWCMFEWAMLFVLLSALLSALCMTGAGLADPGERFLAAEVLVQILILPLGSNNYTFPVLNCLFLIAPFTLWLLRRYRVFRRRRRTDFAWFAMALAVVCAVFVQGGLFHLRFAFGDGTDGTLRQARTGGIPYLNGMYTTPANAASLSALGERLREQELTGEKLIVFGNAPGLHVIFGMEPSLSTTWPDLDSYPSGEMEAELSLLASSGELPVVIVHRTETESVSSPGKRELLRNFLAAGEYEETDADEEYTVMVPVGHREKKGGSQR